MIPAPDDSRRIAVDQSIGGLLDNQGVKWSGFQHCLLLLVCISTPLARIVPFNSDLFPMNNSNITVFITQKIRVFATIIG